MRYYDRQHGFYAGVDLHARTARHGARRIFLGAERKARSHQAEANGEVASTLKSCLVQPRG